MSRRLPLLVLTLTALLVAACGKRAGGSCKGSEATCRDDKTALACHGGRFVEVACRGPAGCAKYRGGASCDTSVASAGEACMGEDDEYACSPDGRRALVCKGGQFQLYLECRGAQGCAMSGRDVSCDTSIARVADPCKAQGALACDEERKQLLVCRHGKMELSRHCRGPGACSEKGDAPSCDESLALPGDPCTVPGQVACSVDGRSELVCESGLFTRARGCKTGCVKGRAGKIECT